VLTRVAHIVGAIRVDTFNTACTDLLISDHKPQTRCGISLVTVFHPTFTNILKVNVRWPARSLDLNLTENVCFAIKLERHVETDVIKARAIG